MTLPQMSFSIDIFRGLWFFLSLFPTVSSGRFRILARIDECPNARPHTSTVPRLETGLCCLQNITYFNSFMTEVAII